jgi:hypothetical protein
MGTILTFVFLMKTMSDTIIAQSESKFMESYSILSFRLPSQNDFRIYVDGFLKQNWL